MFNEHTNLENVIFKYFPIQTSSLLVARGTSPINCSTLPSSTEICVKKCQKGTQRNMPINEIEWGATGTLSSPALQGMVVVCIGKCNKNPVL